MKPTKDQNGVVELLDVLLAEGVLLQADVVVTVAEVPLVGINLRAAIAGMTAMREYGMFEEWDETVRARAPDQTRSTGTVAHGATPAGTTSTGVGGTDTTPIDADGIESTQTDGDATADTPGADDGDGGTPPERGTAWRRPDSREPFPSGTVRRRTDAEDASDTGEQSDADEPE